MNIDRFSKTPALTIREKLPFSNEAYREESEREERSGEIENLRNELRSEIRALKSLIAKSARDGRDETVAGEIAAMRDVIGQMLPPPKKDRISAFLKTRGIEGSVAAKIAASMRASKDDDMTRAFRNAVESLISFGEWSLAMPPRTVIAVVGPAGVGKTTTIAKLAARARMEGRTVSLVSCDSYRVGAVEQLGRFGELLGAEVAVARSARELSDILAASTSDVVFVDTSGRAPTAQSAEMMLASKGAFPAGFTRQVVLAMSATTRAADAQRIVQTFAPLGPTSICITKIDETGMPSGMVHAAAAAKLPLTTLCMGPRVPEDIEQASLDNVVDRFSGKQGAVK